MSNEWQPIETAPKDGSDIDLWGTCCRTDCHWGVPDSPAKDWPRGKEDWLAYHEAWGEWVELNETFTHWMKVEPPNV